MLDSIRDFFDRHLSSTEDPADERAALELAAAALLVEAARIDGDIQPAEHAALLHAVRERFGLGGQQAEALLRQAEQEVREAVGYYPFTSLLNQRFTQEQKERLIELMWQMAYADRHLSADELHLMRKIAGLLHVPDGAYIAAKLRAKRASGAG